MKNILKIYVGLLFGIFIGIFALSFWRNNDIDWQLMISLMIGGLIGIVVVAGIRAYKKANEK